jgi:hypothetical protein
MDSIIAERQFLILYCVNTQQSSLLHTYWFRKYDALLQPGVCQYRRGGEYGSSMTTAEARGASRAWWRSDSSIYGFVRLKWSGASKVWKGGCCSNCSGAPKCALWAEIITASNIGPLGDSTTYERHFEEPLPSTLCLPFMLKHQWLTLTSP